MRLAFTLLLVIHGLIHLLGTLKAFRLAELPAFTQDIPRALGSVWLLAALLCLGTAAALWISPRWWVAGLLAVVVSQGVIATAWQDARFGTLANLLLLVGVTSAYLANRPASLRAEYRREVVEHLQATRDRGERHDAAPLRDEALAHLPDPVQRYLRVSGAVGQPRVRNVRVRFRGRIRSDTASRWMTFTGEQHNFFDTPVRLFYMDASMRGLPVQVLHRYVGPSATMRVRAAGALPVVNAVGEEMDRSETVTLLNDMAWLAPGSLVSDAITWEPIDERSARATFTNARHTISATLFFNAAGEFVDFSSDDRSRASADGSSFTPARWSTPVGAYRAFGAHRLGGSGEARWHTEAGDFAYIEMELLDVAYNVDELGAAATPRTAPPPPSPTPRSP